MSLPTTSIPPDGTPAAAPPYAGLLRNGNPSGNPNAAPRCGAKNRGGKPCRAPAMANGRCRCHGGKSTGPRSPEGRARSAAANFKRGNTTAPKRAEQRYLRTLINRNRLICQARLLWPYLPPAMAARVATVPPELRAPIHPSNLPFVQIPDPPPGTGTAHDRRHPAPPGAPARRLPCTLAAEREAARAEAAALAPWRQAIGAARAAKRARLAARRADRATRHAAWTAMRAARAQAARAAAPAARPDTPPVVLPPAPGTPWTDYTPLERELAARLAGVRARTDNGDQQAAPDPGSAFSRINPVNPEPATTPAPNPTSALSRINPMNPESAAAPAPNPTSALSRINPVNPEPAATPAPNPNSTFSRIDPLNPETGATPKPNPTSPPGRINPVNPEPAAAPAAPAIPPGLPNRAARRRWKSLQRRLHRAPATCSAGRASGEGE